MLVCWSVGWLVGGSAGGPFRAALHGWGEIRGHVQHQRKLHVRVDLPAMRVEGFSKARLKLSEESKSSRILELVHFGGLVAGLRVEG